MCLTGSDELNVLIRNFAVPGYLRKITQCYLRDSELIYDTNQGRRKKYVASGAAQKSILGPDLRNTTSDDIFRIEMPAGAHLIGYAEDVAAIIVAHNLVIKVIIRIKL